MAAKTCPCPHCNCAGVWIPVASAVDYRCFRYALVWSVPKDEQAPITEVTAKAV